MREKASACSVRNDGGVVEARLREDVGMQTARIAELCAELNRRAGTGPDTFASREVEHLGKNKLRRRAEMRLEIHSQDLVMSRRERGDTAWCIDVDRNETSGTFNSNNGDLGARNASTSRSGRFLAG